MRPSYPSRALHALLPQCLPQSIPPHSVISLAHVNEARHYILAHLPVLGQHFCGTTEPACWSTSKSSLSQCAASLAFSTRMKTLPTTQQRYASVVERVPHVPILVQQRDHSFAPLFQAFLAQPDRVAEHPERVRHAVSAMISSPPCRP